MRFIFEREGAARAIVQGPGIWEILELKIWDLGTFQRLVSIIGAGVFVDKNGDEGSISTYR